MRSPGVAYGAAVAFAAMLPGLAPVSAQPPASTQQPPRPTFRTEANFVRVDVYPTRDGQPVDDLAAADFELLEDGAPQAIQTFEHVAIPLPGPQSARVEPNSVRESRTIATDARARVFVIFLDTYHTDVFGSHESRRPLVSLLDRLIGQDDLVAVMTPEMSATDITFARRTLTIEGMLDRSWTWGRRDTVVERDPAEKNLAACFSPAIADELIRRRREKLTLDALTDLVLHLRTIREERKAIVTVTGGWTLPKPDNRLLPQPAPDGRVIGLPPIGIDSNGRIVTRDTRDVFENRADCDRDALLIAQLDLERQFLDLLDTANRGNATFYPVNPHGLEASATVAGQDWIKARTDALHVLAANTDGVAVINTNDLGRGIQRVTTDLSSYYLLGYYSSNAKLDGSYRKIAVRVKRPGVVVRARRGYRAATAAEISEGRAASAAAPTVDADVLAAVGSLSAMDRPATLRLAAGGSFDGTAVWVIGELDTRAVEWRAGGQAMILVSRSGGATLAQGRASIAPGRRTFISRLDGASLTSGDYNVQVRATTPGASPVLETVPLHVAAARSIGAPLLFRRGPMAAQPFEPTADPRFRRNETVRVQTPAGPAAASGVRVTVLDRGGRPLSLPVALSELDQDGARWIAGDVALAPLAAGDYVVRIESGSDRAHVAFRVY